MSLSILLKLLCFRTFVREWILHYEWHVLHSMVQDTDSVTSYVQRLKDQANRCDFGALRNELILSQFVFGLSSSSVCSKLLASCELTLDGAIQEALLNESVSAATGSSEATISTIKSQPFAQHRSGSTSTMSDGAGVSQTSFCYSCGSKSHRRKDCKFRQAFCHLCNKQGHISTVCNSMKTTNAVMSSPPSSSSSDLGSDAMPVPVIMTVSSGCNDLWYESCMVGDLVVNFLIDTGSQATILPYSLAAKSGLAISPISSAVLHAYRWRKS